MRQDKWIEYDLGKRPDHIIAHTDRISLVQIEDQCNEIQRFEP